MVTLSVVLILGGMAAVGLHIRGSAPERSITLPPERPITLRTALDADFEEPMRLWSAPQSKVEGRMTLLRAVEGGRVRRGSMAARFEVRAGDTDVAGSGEGERTEVFLDDRHTGASEGETQWWAWSTYFPTDFDPPPGAWNVFTSFHHTGSTGQANIHFDVRDRTSIGLRVLGGSFDAPAKKDFVLAELQRGKWYDFVFHVKWSSSGSGFVEMWVDGKRVVPLTQTPTLYEGQGVYLKQGYYRSPHAQSTVVFHDGTRRLVRVEAASAVRDEETLTLLR